MRPTRRTFFQGLGAAIIAPVSLGGMAADPCTFSAMPSDRAKLEPWMPGNLDIHHISTGRGNSALLICPDGTSLMVDAGSVSTTKYMVTPRPDASRSSGEWIARYAQRHLSA